MSSNLNPIQLENLRTELIDIIFSGSFNNKVVLYTNYFSTVLDLKDEQFFEAFLKEFIEDFLLTINKFDVWGTDPLFTERLILILEKLSNLTCFETEKLALLKEKERIIILSEKLLDILEGKEYKNELEQKANFPLIDKETTENIYGVIDSISVRISKRTEDDKFIIIPSEKDIEKKIAEQVKTSWNLALSLSKKYLKKTLQFHEVIISFDKRVGFYEGNSLGIALTLSFLEQLLKYYNPVYVINIKEHSAFTGGVDDEGKILTTGEEIIKQKVKAVFFSEIKNFVIPKFEETYAYFALTQLQKDYPKRKFKLIPVEDLNDIVNRRDLVDIQKQKTVVRFNKFIIKNFISLAIIFITFTLIIYWKRPIDKNPISFNLDGNVQTIKNLYGQKLFEIFIHDFENRKYFNEETVCIYDFNSDGINEVAWIDNVDDHGVVYLADYNTDTLWSIKLEKEINYPFNKVSNNYLSRKLKITEKTQKNESFIYVSAINQLFSSFIIQINPKDGSQKNIFINAGHILTFELKDFNQDHIDELLLGGISNDWGGGFFAIIDSLNISGQLPVKNKKYSAKKMNTIHAKLFTVFPLTTLGRQVTRDHNWTAVDEIDINNASKEIRLAIKDGAIGDKTVHFYVTLDSLYNIKDISTSSYYDQIYNELYKNGKVIDGDPKKYLNTNYINEIKNIYSPNENFDE